jgi:cell division protein FtsZ
MASSRAGLPTRFEEIPTKITVLGVGGAGIKAIDSLARSGMELAKLVALDSDLNALRQVKAHEIIQVGENTLRGRGSGGDISLAQKAVDEDLDKVIRTLDVCDLLIAVAGLGGGMGSGGLPYLLRAIRDQYGDKAPAMISIVTIPFRYEGQTKMKNVQSGLREIVVVNDSVVVNMNDVLLEKFGEMPAQVAYSRMDNILKMAINYIVEMLDPRDTLQRLDFPDLKGMIERSGIGFIGIGSHRSVRKAVESAIDTRLLDADPTSASGYLLYIKIPPTASLSEVIDGPRLITEKYDVERISFGARLNPMLRTPESFVYATGVDSPFVKDMIGDVKELLRE